MWNLGVTSDFSVSLSLWKQCPDIWSLVEVGSRVQNNLRCLFLLMYTKCTKICSQECLVLVDCLQPLQDQFRSLDSVNLKSPPIISLSDTLLNYLLLQIATKSCVNCRRAYVLQKGVKKYSQNGVHGFQWKRILEYGSGIFDPSRTYVDLKDKWRNLVKGIS